MKASRRHEKPSARGPFDLDPGEDLIAESSSVTRLSAR
jgi:hypothetical protein